MALCVEAHWASWVGLAWELSASPPQKASEPQALLEAALSELSEVDAGPEVEIAPVAPEEQLEPAAAKERPEQVEGE